MEIIKLDNLQQAYIEETIAQLKSELEIKIRDIRGGIMVGRTYMNRNTDKVYKVQKIIDHPYSCLFDDSLYEDGYFQCVNVNDSKDFNRVDYRGRSKYGDNYDLIVY